MSSSPNPEIQIRPAEPDDIKFVMSSWKKSWRVSPWAGTIRNDEFYASIRSTIDGLIGRGATIQIACLPSKPAQILGWICAETLADGICCIHYIYVKDPYFRLGIGKALIDASAGTKPGLYTHRFRQVSEAIAEVGGVWRHAPEVARRR